MDNLHGYLEQPAHGCFSFKLNAGSISAAPSNKERGLISRPAAGNYPAKTAVSLLAPRCTGGFASFRRLLAELEIT